MNNKVIKPGLLLALSCVIVVSSVACGSVATENQMETANVTLVETANEKRIETPDVKQGDIVPHVTADGRLSFVEHRRLTFGTSGKIGQVNVSELDSVTKGQVLAKLDTTPLEQAVKAAELALKSTEFDRELAENSIKSAEVGLKTAQGNLEAIKVDLEQATDNFRKITYPYTYNTVYLDVPEALGFMHDGELEIMKAVEELQVETSAVNYGEVRHHLRLALDSFTTPAYRYGQVLDTPGCPAPGGQSPTGCRKRRKRT